MMFTNHNRYATKHIIGTHHWKKITISVKNILIKRLITQWYKGMQLWVYMCSIMIKYGGIKFNYKSNKQRIKKVAFYLSHRSVYQNVNNFENKRRRWFKYTNKRYLKATFIFISNYTLCNDIHVYTKSVKSDKTIFYFKIV